MTWRDGANRRNDAWCIVTTSASAPNLHLNVNRSDQNCMFIFCYPNQASKIWTEQALLTVASIQFAKWTVINKNCTIHFYTLFQLLYLWVYKSRWSRVVMKVSIQTRLVLVSVMITWSSWRNVSSNARHMSLKSTNWLDFCSKSHNIL
jgi:hypothetical protein